MVIIFGVFMSAVSLIHGIAARSVQYSIEFTPQAYTSVLARDSCPSLYSVFPRADLSFHRN